MKNYYIIKKNILLIKNSQKYIFLAKILGYDSAKKMKSKQLIIHLLQDKMNKMIKYKF